MRAENALAFLRRWICVSSRGLPEPWSLKGCFGETAIGFTVQGYTNALHLSTRSRKGQQIQDLNILDCVGLFAMVL